MLCCIWWNHQMTMSLQSVLPYLPAHTGKTEGRHLQKRHQMYALPAPHASRSTHPWKPIQEGFLPCLLMPVHPAWYHSLQIRDWMSWHTEAILFYLPTVRFACRWSGMSGSCVLINIYIELHQVVSLKEQRLKVVSWIAARCQQLMVRA